MKRFKNPTGGPAQNDPLIQADIRDILWMTLNVLIAAPDPGGELTQVRHAIADFAERRREEVDE